MNNLEIYIHIPFCVKKCDYCDFLSFPAGEDKIKDYVKAVECEIELNKEAMEEYLVDTVFIGGGTPSILEGKQIGKILESLRKNCNMSEMPEITIECNPGTVTSDKLLEYKSAGINRISFGLQSANDEELKSIGRIHNYAQFTESYQMARDCGFRNINIDLMSGLVGQSLDSYKETLEKVTKLHPEHISAYSLIVEENTPMYDRVNLARTKGINILPEEDEEREMYYLTKELLQDNGYERYEISNYSKKGFECRHNIGYWKRKEYLGFGIGAASLYKGKRWNNISDLQEYVNKMVGNKDMESVRINTQILSEQDAMEEFMFLGLRMMEGISIKEFKEKFHAEYKNVYGKVQEKMIRQKLLLCDGDRVKLTDKGVDVSNYVMSEFVTVQPCDTEDI